MSTREDYYIIKEQQLLYFWLWAKPLTDELSLQSKKQQLKVRLDLNSFPF